MKAPPVTRPHLWSFLGLVGALARPPSASSRVKVCSTEHAARLLFGRVFVCVLCSAAACLCACVPCVLLVCAWASSVILARVGVFRSCVSLLDVRVCVCVCSMCTGLVFCIRRPVIVCGLINVCICVSTPITGLPPSTVSFGRTLMPCPLVCGRAWSSILLNSLLHDCKCIDDHEHL